MGLYGNILVVPADPDYWPSAHREVLLTLDDVLIEDGKIAPFSRSETTYAAMGRFGNVLLVGGETDLSLSAERGEVVRFYLTNTANTRVFNIAVPEEPVADACPVSPDSVGDEPGSCPKCCMKLLATAALASYVCPMHPEVISDKPDKCPKCGMKLLPAEPVSETSEHSAHAHD